MKKTKLLLLMAVMVLGLASSAFANALLVENGLPWGWNSNSDTLNAIGIPFTKINSNLLATTNLDLYDFVTFASVQDQAFYNDVAANTGKVNSFVNNGGVLIAHSCLWGWPMNGVWTAPNYLPGGVDRVQEYTQTVNVTDPLHPVVSGPYGTVTEAEFQGWNYTSHGYFTNLVAGTKVILDQGVNKPIYIEYAYGAGTVRASMMTVEWGEGQNTNTRYIFRQNEYDAAQRKAEQGNNNEVPEPATMVLMASGLAGLFLKRKKA